MANRKLLNITKFSGSHDGVPVDEWLHLFDKADAGEWTEQKRTRNFNEYVENDALKWYLTEVTHTDETWDGVRERMIARSQTPVVDRFRVFVHCRIKKRQAVRQYLDEKNVLEHCPSLKTNKPFPD